MPSTSACAAAAWRVAQIERGSRAVARASRACATSSGAIALSASSGWRRFRSASALREVELAAAIAASYCDAVLGLLAHLAHGVGERAARLGERDLGVGRIELDQHLAGVDALRVVGEHRDHGAGDLRRDATWLPLT